MDDDINVEEHEQSKLYQQLNETNPCLFIKIIIALNNFKAYLSNDTIEIDYEYLWDIICIPLTGDRGDILEDYLMMD